MNGTNEQIAAAVRGLDPEVIAEYAKQFSTSVEAAAEDLKKLGEALLEAELDSAGPVQYTNRAARRARARAGRGQR